MLKLTNTSHISKVSVIEFNKGNLNNFKKLYKNLRQQSKPISFALQYGGTHSTLEKNCGIPAEEAKAIIENYKKLYKVSEENKEFYLKKATMDGYVLGAFNLRIRTPLLKQSLVHTKATPREVEAEGRTATNARFQSWGLLNCRTVMEVLKAIRKDPKLRMNIKPMAQIHDASYWLVRDDVQTLLWLNKKLVEEANWNKDPVIYHPEVGLGGELSVFYPTWKDELVIPNECDEFKLEELTTNYLKEL